MTIKILFILGTRPEAVKIAPLYRALKADSSFHPMVALTGQHPTMAVDILSFFDIVPDYNIALKRTNFSLSEFTSECLRELDNIVTQSKPDLIFVHGDTSSTFCGALTAYYHKIPVAHLEAGLRTNDKYSPFPEEMMRKMTGALAEYHFAPTETAQSALLRENIPQDKIWVVGNTVIDALLWASRKLDDDATFADSICTDLHALGFPKDDNRKFILITGHRRENFGPRFNDICNAIKQSAQDHPDHDFIYPVHLNPNVQAPVNAILNGIPNVRLIPPVGYAHFIYLMKKCRFILTDSGGIQEEAPSLHKPVLVMRDTTERPEAVAANCARLVGTAMIAPAINELISSPQVYDAMTSSQNPYGTGDTADKIVTILKQTLKV